MGNIAFHRLPPPEPFIVQRGSSFSADTPTLLNLVQNHYGHPRAHLLTTHFNTIEHHDLKTQILEQPELRKFIQLGNVRNHGELRLVMPIRVPSHYHDAEDEKWFAFFGLRRHDPGQKLITLHGYAKLGIVQGIEEVLHDFDRDGQLHHLALGKTLNKEEVLHLLTAH